MKIIKIFSFILLALCNVSAYCSERSILFLQQMKPGHIIYVSMNEKGQDTFVSVVGMGAATIKKEAIIATRDFSKLWKLANSKELMSFKLSSSDNGNMADPNFYTVNIGSGDKSKTILQIPVKEIEGATEEFVNEFKKFIEAKS